MNKTVVLLFVMGWADWAFADINRCIDKNGGVTFQQAPCPSASPTVPRSERADLERDKKDRKEQAEQNRKSVTANLEMQLEAEKKRVSNLPRNSTAPVAQVNSTSEAMNFAQCKRAVGQTILKLGPAAIINTRFIVSSPTISMTRICTTQGSLLITCNSLDSTMVTTHSPDC